MVIPGIDNWGFIHFSVRSCLQSIFWVQGKWCHLCLDRLPPPPHTQTSCVILITRLEPKPPLIFGWRNFLKIPIINQLLGEIEYNIVSSYFELLKSSKYQGLKWILYCYFLNVSLSGCLIGSNVIIVYM